MEDKFVELLKDIADKRNDLSSLEVQVNKNKSELAKTYRKAAIELEDIGVSYLFENKLDDIQALNRKLRQQVKDIDDFASQQEDNYLYTMGMYTGMFHMLGTALVKRNDELNFNNRMSQITTRPYVKQILKYMSDAKCAVTCNEICRDLNIESEQLVEYILNDLHDIGAVYVFYQIGYILKDRAEDYIKEHICNE